MHGSDQQLETNFHEYISKVSIEQSNITDMGWHPSHLSSNFPNTLGVNNQYSFFFFFFYLVEPNS